MVSFRASTLRLAADFAALRLRSALLCLLLAGVLAACGQPGPPPAGSGSADDGSSAGVDVARRQLAGELGVAADDLRLVSLQPVRWPDSSLGCPQPGTSYIQVVTPGYRVFLEYAGQRYELHVAGRRAVRCDSPKRLPPAAGSPTPLQLQ